MRNTFDGQWMGRVTGDAPGLIVVELDDAGPEISGVAYHFPDDVTASPVVAYLGGLQRIEDQVVQNVTVRPINPFNGVTLSMMDAKAAFGPDAFIPETADVSVKFLERDLQITFTTAQTTGSAVLSSSDADLPSKIAPLDNLKTWEDFKREGFSVESNRYMYRGQSVGRRLRTSFHRTKRKNTARYTDLDIAELRRVLSPRLRHVFDARDPMQTGALYNLVQHHGYPTPLLDWSMSPFVAAFFAFRPPPRQRALTECVRIFVFDRKSWTKNHQQFGLASYTRPHFSIIDLMAIENPRMIPQQATATITNVDDIEAYISSFERTDNIGYLFAVDIPLSERQQALSELDLMGINAGSLFPGLDGTCEALAYKNFGSP